MIKWLMVIGVVSFVYFYFIKKKPIQQTTKDTHQKKDKTEANDMIECSKCGIYCEIDDMILSGSKYYCSQECLEGV